MAQKLILPINKAILTASMYNQAYKNLYGWVHYGIDMISSVGDTTLYASGDGEIIAAGWDTAAGNTVVIRYNDVYNHKTGQSIDVIFRYCHLNKISVAKGDTTTKDTVIGQYGGSGNGQMNKWSPHLHLEADTDTTYPTHTPQFGTGGGVLKGSRLGATAKSMINPLDVLHCKTSAPDDQIYSPRNDPYINADDRIIPTIV